ncbi:MAG: DUF1697 domain-containing protein [Chloroflexi bacterium]|nr:DUF1697 domain-containing protein [Chloroflexota bacterium]
MPVDRPTAATRSIAFLGSINVGGHTVKMDRLRTLFEECGLSGVETFIASGNVIFASPLDETPALEQRLEGHLLAALGFPVPTYIRSVSELAAVAQYQPFSPADIQDEGHTLYIGFHRSPLNGEVGRRLRALQTPDDEFHVHQRELYWLRRKKISESTISGALLAKTIGMPATLRNATTVRRLAAKYPAQP